MIRKTHITHKMVAIVHRKTLEITWSHVVADVCWERLVYHMGRLVHYQDWQRLSCKRHTTSTSSYLQWWLIKYLQWLIQKLPSMQTHTQPQIRNQVTIVLCLVSLGISELISAHKCHLKHIAMRVPQFVVHRTIAIT